MNTKKILTSTAFLLTLGTILGFGILSHEPAEANASCSGMLMCNAEVTRPIWGIGATCAEAAADFQQQANAMVPTLKGYCETDYCGPCMTPPIFNTDPCVDSGGHKMVDGTVTVLCLEEPFGDVGPM